MYFAGAAYCGRSLGNLSCPWCGNITAYNYSLYILIQDPVWDTITFIAISPTQNNIVVSFRGTLNVPNVILNLDLVKVSAGSIIMVHQGFKTAVYSSYSDVVGNLTVLINANPSFNLVVTGHSLGVLWQVISSIVSLLKMSYPQQQFHCKRTVLRVLETRPGRTT